MKTALTRHFTHGLIVVGVTHIVSFCHATPAVLNSYRIVAMSGQPAPGAPAGMVFTGLVNPVLNNAGETAFVAGAYDPAVPGSDRIGIWSESGGNLHLVTLDGMVPPGSKLPTYNLPFGSVFAFNDRGETAFQTSNAIWMENGHSLELVAGAGHQVMVDNHLVGLSSPSRPVINREGLVAFAAVTASREGVYVGRDGSFKLIADEHMVPTDPNDFSASLEVPPAINFTGETAFFEGIGAYYGSIWTTVLGRLERLARAQSSNYGPGETKFHEVKSPIVTATGKVVFFASLAGNDVTESDDAVLLKFDERGLRSLVREGDHAPGFPADISFSFIYYEDSISPRPVSDDAGNLAFSAGLRGSDIDFYNQESIWRVRDDAPELAIQSGIEPTGAPGTRLLHVDNPLLSKTGRIAFWGQLTGDFIQSTNDAGIWAEDLQGNFQLIAREGDMVDVDPGPNEDMRRIAELTLLQFYESRGEDDQPYAFNNRGQIAFRVAFSDLTQAILVSNLVVIPEPSTWLLIGIGFGLVRTSDCRAVRLWNR